MIAHKSDIEVVRTLIALGYPRVAPVLPYLLEWIQDGNWPVADRLFPFLASIGAPMLPEIRRVFATDDDMWKYWCILLLAQMDVSVVGELHEDLTIIAHEPTAGEEESGAAEQARKLLQRMEAQSRNG